MDSHHLDEPRVTDSGAQIMDRQIELEDILLHEDLEPMALSYQLLNKITDDFSDKLEIGRGGFAVVYKAILDNGVVAVKRLSNMYMHEDKFKREVECLMNAKHKNIVRFLGYCSDTQGNMGSYDGKWIMAEVQERLLCFEYLSKGSLEGYIKDSLGEIEWRKRYHIIKGICEGLNYLHQKNIMHLDLKPENILLDEDMTAKITDFGLSRCFDKDQTRVMTNSVAGTMGYLAPECYRSEKITITHKLDLYSLGIIIMEMLTGKKGYQITVENVLEIWSKSMVDELQLEQIRVCATIGIECIDLDPAKRPASMSHIIDRLTEIECSTHAISIGGTIELLLLQQVTLCFPFQPNKVIMCPLELTNNTDKRVAFRLTDKSTESFINLPLHGLVPPNTTYTLVLTTKEKKDRPRKYIADLILQSVISSLCDDWYIGNGQSLPNNIFHETGNAAQMVKLKALYTQRQHNTTSLSNAIMPTIKIIFSMEKNRELLRHSLDINHAKKWITMGYQDGIVVFWDYETQSKVDWLKVSADDEIVCIKFIARKQWIVAGTLNGNIHVYNYEEMKRITSFTAGTYESLQSLAVHPTRPYLLSAGIYIKLWNWDHGWECIRTFEYEDYKIIVGFSPNDTFASTSMVHPIVECTKFESYVIEGDYTVKVWSLDSPKYEYALDGHSNRVVCLDFLTYHGHDFLVTGSDDKTAKIWYLETKECAYTLEAFVSPVTSVLYQPDLQTLFTGSNDGAIYLWSTANCRVYSCPPTLTKVINIGGFGKVYHLTYVMGRVIIGKGNKVAIMDIDNEKCQEQSMDYQETTPKEITGSINKLLNIHPQKLCFPYHPNEPISCALHLTNVTDENVAFRLFDKSGKSPWCFTKLPLYGIVSPKSVHTLIVTTKEEMKLKDECDFDLVIQSSLLGDKYNVVFEDQSECDQLFEEAIVDMVHEVTLEAYYVHWNRIYEHRNILVKYNPDKLISLDAHPTEPWIVSGHISGHAHVWNHEIKLPINSFKVDKRAVCSIKFVARKDWIIAATGLGLCVFDCACITKVKLIMIVQLSHGDVLLAVHPNLPYVLTPGIRLLDWDKGWYGTQSFSADDKVQTLTFNAGDDNRFASGSLEGQIKVWTLDSSAPEYSLLGHLKAVTFLDFITHGDQTHLISGSKDCTAKIWDLQKRECIYTLEAMSPVRCVLAHPYLPVIITGAEHGIIHLWSFTDFRLKRTINFGGGGPVVGLACLIGSQRIVIGQENAISTMEIHCDEETRSERSQDEATSSADEDEAEHEERKQLTVTLAQQGPPTQSRNQRRRNNRRARMIPERAEAQARPSQPEAERAEAQARPSQPEEHRAGAQARPSQPEAERGDTEEAIATREQQALPPMWETPRAQRRREKRHSHSLAK